MESVEDYVQTELQFKYNSCKVMFVILTELRQNTKLVDRMCESLVSYFSCVSVGQTVNSLRLTGRRTLRMGTLCL